MPLQQQLAPISGRPIRQQRLLPQFGPSYTACAGTQAAGQSTFQQTIGRYVAKGDVLVVGASSNSAATVATGVSDSQNNQYILWFQDTTRAPNLSIFVAQACAPMVLGTDTITTTFLGTATLKNVIVRGCAGFPNIDTFGIKITDSNTGTNPTVGPTQTLLTPNEWSVAFLVGGATALVPSNWTGGYFAGPTVGSGPFLTVADQFTTTNAPLTAGATVAAGTTWTFGIMTLTTATPVYQSGYSPRPKPRPKHTFMAAGPVAAQVQAAPPAALPVAAREMHMKLPAATPRYDRIIQPAPPQLAQMSPEVPSATVREERVQQMFRRLGSSRLTYPPAPSALSVPRLFKRPTVTSKFLRTGPTPLPPQLAQMSPEVPSPTVRRWARIQYLLTRYDRINTPLPPQLAQMSPEVPSPALRNARQRRALQRLGSIRMPSQIPNITSVTTVRRHVPLWPKYLRTSEVLAPGAPPPPAVFTPGTNTPPRRKNFRPKYWSDSPPSAGFTPPVAAPVPWTHQRIRLRWQWARHGSIAEQPLPSQEAQMSPEVPSPAVREMRLKSFAASQRWDRINTPLPPQQAQMSPEVPSPALRRWTKVPLLVQRWDRNNAPLPPGAPPPPALFVPGTNVPPHRKNFRPKYWSGSPSSPGFTPPPAAPEPWTHQRIRLRWSWARRGSVNETPPASAAPTIPQTSRPRRVIVRVARRTLEVFQLQQVPEQPQTVRRQVHPRRGTTITSTSPPPTPPSPLYGVDQRARYAWRKVFRRPPPPAQQPGPTTFPAIEPQFTVHVWRIPWQVAVDLRWFVNVIVKWVTGAQSYIRWTTGLNNRWVINVTYSMSSLSTELVPIDVTATIAGIVTDPTQFTIQAAIKLPGVDPTNVDWQSASWLGGVTGATKIAQTLVGPLAKGEWSIWVKIAATPENVVKEAGTIEVY